MEQGTYRSIFRPGLFQDQVVLVTGGGSGIGRCTAHELVELGARIALVGRKEDKLRAVQAEIVGGGGEADIWTCDIRDEDMVQRTVAGVLDRFGRIDHLFNNAGGQYATPLEKISKKGFEAVVSSNLTGGFLMARECFTQCMREHGGTIVNMVMDMWNGTPDMGHSGAARAGMVNLTMTAALEWGPYNVRVNAVAPGLVFSSGVDHYPPEFQARLLAFGKEVPLGRSGTEAETSAAIVFLMSEGASFITGTTINIDGGIAMATPVYKLAERNAPAPAFDGFHRATTPKLLQKGTS